MPVFPHKFTECKNDFTVSPTVLSTNLFKMAAHHSMMIVEENKSVSYTYYSPVLVFAEYTPMYMVWVTFSESGISQQ